MSEYNGVSGDKGGGSGTPEEGRDKIAEAVEKQWAWLHDTSEGRARLKKVAGRENPVENNQGSGVYDCPDNPARWIGTMGPYRPLTG